MNDYFNNIEIINEFISDIWNEIKEKRLYCNIIYKLE